MSSAREIEQLEEAARYYRDRVALLRAKRYRWGLGSSVRMRQLERGLALAEKRLSEERSRQAH